MTTGHLIVFEGLDGSGKSTQVELLATALRVVGFEVVETAEPTRGEWGHRIRTMARGGQPVPPQKELRWFMADRREHIDHLIVPAMETGCVVLSDRYYLSTVAYQGARGLDWREILETSEREFLIPDLVLLLDIDPSDGLLRVKQRGGIPEPAFEDASFLDGVAAIYACIDRPYIERIDARDDSDTVAARVRDAVSRRIGGPL